MTARGSQIGIDPTAYRLDYELETAEAYVTRRLAAESAGEGWSRRIELVRHADGRWECLGEGGGGELPEAGGDTDAVAEALDCDLGFSPLTNTMPVLRAGLLEDVPDKDFVMAWVSVPDLSLHRSEQRYEHVRRDKERAIVRYVGRHRDFVGELEFDSEGLIVRYPDLADRVFPAPKHPPRR
jgi:uncharacterized protein